jgi:hypothetical protein
MPENVHLYRAAVLAWRKAAIEERSRHADIRLANPHVAEHAAALAVHELASISALAMKILTSRLGFASCGELLAGWSVLPLAGGPAPASPVPPRLCCLAPVLVDAWRLKICLKQLIVGNTSLNPSLRVKALMASLRLSS